ncbi:hypothetical protein RchiOBHm_Chr6g0295591 [Rosa chinensis]|uniref:Uncharacterized protein n=1 Tax=Rosa chinensis TaxID=74649 RepID=A0A2P6PX66_ROSCH|nr:hypothetical protein RchiOBHm_Chr6g0295591 [Rosa chinensis]
MCIHTLIQIPAHSTRWSCVFWAKRMCKEGQQSTSRIWFTSISPARIIIVWHFFIILSNQEKLSVRNRWWIGKCF